MFKHSKTHSKAETPPFWSILFLCIAGILMNVRPNQFFIRIKMSPLCRISGLYHIVLRIFVYFHNLLEIFKIGNSYVHHIFLSNFWFHYNPNTLHHNTSLIYTSSCGPEYLKIYLFFCNFKHDFSLPVIITFLTLDHFIFTIFFIKNIGPLANALQNRHNRFSLLRQWIFHLWRNFIIRFTVNNSIFGQIF